MSQKNKMTQEPCKLITENYNKKNPVTTQITGF